MPPFKLERISMNTERRDFVSQGAAAAAVAVAAALPVAAQAAMPPTVAAPAGARPVLVTLRLSAKDAGAFRAHLLKVIPVTRIASGCRYSHTYQDPAVASEFVLVQGWDSAEQQQAYIQWRESTGDLAEFLAFLSKPPVVERFALIDA